jgi:hypothetical protein
MVIKTEGTLRELKETPPSFPERGDDLLVFSISGKIPI